MRILRYVAQAHMIYMLHLWSFSTVFEIYRQVLLLSPIRLLLGTLSAPPDEHHDQQN